jgi:hypothetical protein
MINQIVAGSMLAEGIVFGVWAYVMFRKKRARLARCQRTWGDVIAVKEHSGGEGPTRHPVIRYQTATGEEVTFESKFGSSNWKVKPGDRLEILVTPGNPSDAEVVSFMAQWGLSLILAMVSIGSVIGAPVVYLLLRR